jgi:hypothetical protein
MGLCVSLLSQFKSNNIKTRTPKIRDTKETLDTIHKTICQKLYPPRKARPTPEYDEIKARHAPALRVTGLFVKQVITNGQSKHEHVTTNGVETSWMQTQKVTTHPYSWNVQSFGFLGWSHGNAQRQIWRWAMLQQHKFRQWKVAWHPVHVPMVPSVGAYYPRRTRGRGNNDKLSHLQWLNSATSEDWNNAQKWMWTHAKVASVQRQMTKWMWPKGEAQRWRRQHAIGANTNWLKEPTKRTQFQWMKRSNTNGSDTRQYEVKTLKNNENTSWANP